MRKCTLCSGKGKRLAWISADVYDRNGKFVKAGSAQVEKACDACRGKGEVK